MCWDGLGFFGFDDAKLARLRGEKVTFFTKFKSWKRTIVTLAIIGMALFILVTELLKYNTVKSSITRLEDISRISYDVEKVLDIMGTNYFYTD